MEISSINHFQSQPEKRIESNISVNENNTKKSDGKKTEQVHSQIKKQKPITDTFELSKSEKKYVEELKARDREVRTHENQHKAAAGQYAWGVTYSYQTGPDNQRYAIGGQINIDTSPVPNDPEKTVEKMKQIKKAALAPSEPSQKDKQIAAMADREISKNQMKADKEKTDKMLNAFKEPENKAPIFDITL